MVQRTLLYIYTLYIYGYFHIAVIEGCIRVYKYHRGYNVTIAFPGKWKMEKIYCTGRPRRSCCEAGTPALDTQFTVSTLIKKKIKKERKYMTNGLFIYGDTGK
jgi:hypothetical protein